MSVNFDILNQKGSPAIYSDVFANRPTASYAGRLFISTDTKEIYRDTGSAWEEIAGQGSGNIQGSGTANYVPKFTDTETIGNSQIRDDGTGVGIGVAPSAVYKLDISGSQRNTLSAAGGLSIVQSGVLEASYGVYNSSSGAAFLFEKFDDATATFSDSGIFANGGFYTKVFDGTTNFYNSFFSNGNVAFGSVTDAGYKLDVNGTGRFSGALTGANLILNGTATTALDLTSGTYSYALDFENNDFIRQKNAAGTLGLLLGISTDDSTLLRSPSVLKFQSNAGGSEVRLTAAGRLLVGTTTESTFLLDVNGTGRFISGLSVISTSGSADYVADRYNTSSGATFQYKTNGTINWYSGLRGLADNNFYIFNNMTSTNTLILNESSNTATFSNSIAIGNTVAVSVATPSTHKVTMVIGGTTYYLLASNV